MIKKQTVSRAGLMLALVFAFSGVQQAHAGVTDSVASAVKSIKTNVVNRSTRFDHAISLLTGLAVVKGMQKGEYVKVAAWLPTFLASVIGSLTNNHELKRLVRFMAAGSLVGAEVLPTPEIYKNKFVQLLWKKAKALGIKAKDFRANLPKVIGMLAGVVARVAHNATK